MVVLCVEILLFLRVCTAYRPVIKKVVSLPLAPAPLPQPLIDLATIGLQPYFYSRQYYPYFCIKNSQCKIRYFFDIQTFFIVPVGNFSLCQLAVFYTFSVSKNLMMLPCDCCNVKKSTVYTSQESHSKNPNQKVGETG